MLKKVFLSAGCSKMPRCKAPEILRSEAYLQVRCNDEERGERSRWAFFNILLRLHDKRRFLRFLCLPFVQNSMDRLGHQLDEETGSSERRSGVFRGPEPPPGIPSRRLSSPASEDSKPSLPSSSSAPFFHPLRTTRPPPADRSPEPGPLSEPGSGRASTRPHH